MSSEVKIIFLRYCKNRLIDWLLLPLPAWRLHVNVSLHDSIEHCEISIRQFCSRDLFLVNNKVTILDAHRLTLLCKGTFTFLYVPWTIFPPWTINRMQPLSALAFKVLSSSNYAEFNQVLEAIFYGAKSNI